MGLLSSSTTEAEVEATNEQGQSLPLHRSIRSIGERQAARERRQRLMLYLENIYWAPTNSFEPHSSSPHVHR